MLHGFGDARPLVDGLGAQPARAVPDGAGSRDWPVVTSSTVISHWLVAVSSTVAVTVSPGVTVSLSGSLGPRQDLGPGVVAHLRAHCRWSSPRPGSPSGPGSGRCSHRCPPSPPRTGFPPTTRRHLGHDEGVGHLRERCRVECHLHVARPVGRRRVDHPPRRRAVGAARSRHERSVCNGGAAGGVAADVVPPHDHDQRRAPTADAAHTTRRFTKLTPRTMRRSPTFGVR